MLNNGSTLRETDPALFKAFNLLKQTGSVYSRYNPSEYDLLEKNRDVVDYWLSCDDCELMISDEYGMARICFCSDADTSFSNSLRGRLSLSEMKVYLALNAIYDEGYVRQGIIVMASYDEVVNKMNFLGLKLNGGAVSSKASIMGLIRSMKLYGFVMEKQGDLLILPAVKFGLSTFEFSKICNSTLNSWLDDQKRDLLEAAQEKDTDTDVDDVDLEDKEDFE